MSATTSDGMQMSSVVGELAGAVDSRTGAITDVGGAGMNIASSSLVVTDFTIENAASSGIDLTSGTYSFTSTTVTNAVPAILPGCCR